MPVEPAATQSLNHFRLDRELARGGMGAVYLGFDVSLQRPVAIKVIRPEFASQQTFLDRFLREARAQAQIAHSNVVQVYFVGQEHDVVFIAMELVDGGSLEALLERQGPLDWKDALRHLRGLAEGLREAARLNIIHRDIKPANILLDRFGLAHLADFGLAAPVLSREQPVDPAPPDVNGPPALARLTQVGMVMGSPAYMSPEQATAQVLDVRTDIYGLGATFYQLLCGEPPTTAQTFHELQAFLVGPPPRPLVERRPDIPRRFAALIDRCMARSLQQRFRDYDQLIDALDRAVPRPIVKAGAVPRVLSWLVDVAVYAAVTRATLQLWPLLGFAALALWVLLGHAVLGASPGQWMMRLSLRRPPDAPVPLARAGLRFALQHGWLAFVSLAVAAVYRGSDQTLTLAWAGAAVALFALSGPGSLAALFGADARTAVDRLSGTRVLVDVR